MNNAVLDKELDKTKSKVFLENNAAFLGCVMCSLTFRWDSSVPTACTDGLSLSWNPEWFISLPEETRKTVLIHELWHVARLHSIRAGTRRAKEWNWACDIVINNGLEDDGYSFVGTDPWINQDYSGLSEEEIYEKLIDENEEMSNSPWLAEGEPECDLKEQDTTEQQQILSVVVKAVQTAKLMKQSSDATSTIEELINKLMKPVIPWQTLLYRFFDSLMSDEFSWKRPNRRYEDIYLPSRVEDDSFLKNLNYYFDVSGSVTLEEIARFNTEVKFIKDTFNPEKLTIVQFDTKIRDELVVESNDSFDKLRVIGRGGTRLQPVRRHILDSKPTAAIIFSDLCCPPMQELGVDIPIVWVVIANPETNPKFGTVIHIPR